MKQTKSAKNANVSTHVIMITDALPTPCADLQTTPLFVIVRKISLVEIHSHSAKGSTLWHHLHNASTITSVTVTWLASLVNVKTRVRKLVHAILVLVSFTLHSVTYYNEAIKSHK